MRTAPQVLIAASLIGLMAFFAGCASMPEGGQIPEVNIRQLPVVNLGPEIILLEEVKLDYNSRFASLSSADGRNHIFITDKNKQVHHIEFNGNEVFMHEILGVMESTSSYQALDVIEHPLGKLRVVAGDKMFIRSENSKWQEIRGNRCERFITVGNDLLCAFLAKGKDVGDPQRRDWTFGWFILIPVVFWQDVHADKLVLAQESKECWTIQAVFDPEIKLSTNSDFMTGRDQKGDLYFLYRATGGNTSFFVGCGGLNCAGGGSDQYTEIRYAVVPYDRLRLHIPDTDNHEKTPWPWLSIQGTPVAPLPDNKVSSVTLQPGQTGPLERHFAMNQASGAIDGLMYTIINEGPLKNDGALMQVKIRQGQLVPHLDIVAADGLPDARWTWGPHPIALIKSDAKGNNHLLLSRSKVGILKGSTEMCYFVNTGAGWSAPLVVGYDSQWELGGNLLALDIETTGRIFAAWVDGHKRVVGRWIMPRETKN